MTTIKEETTHGHNRLTCATDKHFIPKLIARTSNLHLPPTLPSFPSAVEREGRISPKPFFEPPPVFLRLKDPTTAQ